MNPIQIPQEKVAFLREHSTLLDTLADITPNEDLILQREDFPVLTDEQWTILGRLVKSFNMADDASIVSLAEQLNSIFVVSEYAERNELTVTAIYEIAKAMYEFIGDENGNLDQLPEIFHMGGHINNIGVLSHRLGGVSAENFKQMGDYLGLSGGRRKRKTRKVRKH